MLVRRCGGRGNWERGAENKYISGVHPAASCGFHFAKGETDALAKLTSRQHSPEVIGSALIFI